MPESLEERIRNLSASGLQSYKRQLRALPEEDRQRAFSRLSGIPELEDLIGRPAISMREPARQEPQRTLTREEEVPLWQRALSTISKPFEWIEEKITKPFGAFVLDPFTPAVAGTESLPFWERQRAEYQAWDDPNIGFLGVKGVTEFLPWLLVPSAAGILGKAGMAGAKGAGLLGIAQRGGALGRAAGIAAKGVKPVAAVERAITYPIAKPLEMAARKLIPKAQEVSARLIADLQPIDEAIGVAMQPSKLRTLVNVNVAGKQPLKRIAQMIAGRAATANDPATLSLVGRDVLRFEGATKSLAAIATLNRMGLSKKIFNLTDEGLMTIGGEQVHLNTIRTYPKKYWAKLNEQQRSWIDQASLLEREKKALFDRYGVEVPELLFEEGGEYAGRRVVARFDPEGGLLDVAYVGTAQPGRPGAKTAAEKARVFADIDDALKEGYRYLPEEEALYYNIVGAYNRVGDKQFADWFLERVPWRTTAGPEDLKAQVNLYRTGISSARASLRTAHKQLRRSAGDIERRQGVTFRATEEVGDLLENITTKQALRQNTAYLRGRLLVEKKYANRLARTYAKAATKNERAYTKVLEVEDRLTKRLDELAEIEPVWKDALAKARRAPFGGASAPDIPAFAGKVFTSPEAKEYLNIIRKELDPSFNSALTAINQVNAVGRYFALAGDVSPFAIQLIFLAGANPKAFGKSIGGFVRAFFDPLYHDNLLAKNIGLIQRHPGLMTTKGGVTEMTEAMARGGLLRKGPLKIAGKALEPFQRGFESALDTAGIEMAKVLEHLGTTPARMAQVDAFINEFRGLINTSRIGISSTQRQLERATILAPQYNRAIGALLWDITQGNLRGQLARRAVARGVGAVAAMTVAVSYALGESEEEIVDHLNPLSTNFMTWDIAGQRVGPGSKVRSLLYMAGKMAKSPEDAGYHAGRFLQGNFSPFMGTSMDLITGKSYMGDPTRDGLPNLTKTVLGENLLPIWVQSVAFEGGDFSQRVTRGMAEFGGLRAYPSGAYTMVKDLQDELAQEAFGVSWDELGTRPDGMVQQMRITRESSELQELSKKAEEESAKFARGEQLVWNEYGRRTDEIGEVVATELNLAAKQFEDTNDGPTLRERVNRAYWLKAQMTRDLLESGEFEVVRETFDEPLTEQERAEMQPQKLLYRDYNNSMYASDMFDKFGEYRFDEADRRRESFVQQYGLEALNSIEAVIGERRADEPPAVKMLREARVLLAPYWQITDAIWQMYPPELQQLSDQIKLMERTDPDRARMVLKRYPAILRARELIAKYRKQMRDTNPIINRAYRLFYG